MCPLHQRTAKHALKLNIWAKNLGARLRGKDLKQSVLGLKNIERHAADPIVSWPNPKQWVLVHTSNLMMTIRQSILILSIITREMGKLKTYSSTYCIMDNGENMLNLTHKLDKIYLTGILWIQCLQISLDNDANEMVYCANKRVRSASKNVTEYLHSS